jgi:hypothetical protein
MGSTCEVRDVLLAVDRGHYSSYNNSYGIIAAAHDSVFSLIFSNGIIKSPEVRDALFAVDRGHYSPL